MDSTFVLYWIICYLSLQLGIQFFLKLITGVSFSYFNPLTLSVSNLGWSHSSTQGEITCKSIRFSFSIFGLCNKLRSQIGNQYLFWILDDVLIDLSKFDNNTTTTTSKSSKPNVHPAESEIFDQFDFKQPINVYPNSSILKIFLSWILYLTPAVGIQINNLTIICPNGIKLRLHNLKAQTNIDNSFERKKLLIKSKKDNFYQWLTTVHLDNFSMYDQSSNALLSTFFDISTISSQFKINSSTGQIKEMKNYVRFKGTDISFLYLLKLINGFNKFSTTKSNEKEKGEEEQTFNDNEKDYDNCGAINKNRLAIGGFIYKLVHSINISIQFFKISEIPIVNKSQMIELINQDEISKFNDILFTSFTVDTITTNIEQLNPSNVGYNLKYVTGSYPLNWLFTLSSIKCSLDFSTFQNYSGKLKKFEILSIPNVLLSVDSTMLINILRFVFNNDEKFDRRHTLLDLQCTITKLTLDISSEQLGIVIFSLNKSPDKNSKSSLRHSFYNHWKEKFSNILFKINPNWSYKLLFEKPTFIIKSENESIGKDIHISYLSPSLINFELDIMATTKSVDILSRFDIPNLSFFYQRNNDNKNSNNFFSVKDINYKNSFNISDAESFYSWLDINFIDLNLINLSTLNGLREILSNTLKQILTREQLIDKEQRVKKKFDDIKRGEIKRHMIFKDPPNWFKQTKIQLRNIKLKIGAKSILKNFDDLIAEDDISLPSSTEFKLNKFEVLIDNDSNEITATSNSSSTQSENSKSSSEYYYMATLTLKNFQILTNTQKPDGESKLTENFIDLPLLTTKIYITKENKFEIVNYCNTLTSMWSMSNNFTIFSTIYLLKNTILEPFVKQSKNCSDESKLLEDKIHLEPSKQEGFKINFRSYIKEFQFKFKLSNDFHGRLDLFGIKVIAMNNPIFFKSKLLRLSVKKDSKSKFYNRLLTFENLSTKFKLSTDSNGMKILIDTSNVKLSVPSNFIVHTLFDSIKLSVKLKKRFIYILKTNDSEMIPPINEMRDLKLPTMRLRSRDLSFVLEDDPFEAELGTIFQLGLVEQELRLRKLKEFNKYVEDAKLRSDNDPKLNQLLDEIYSNPSNLQKKNENPIVDEYTQKLYKLRVNLSKSWKKTVNEFKLKKNKATQENFEFLTGTLSSRLPASAKFNSHIVDFNGDAPLMGILFSNVVITVSNPLFHKDGGDIKKFLHRVGKGYPMDSKWNQLVPMKFKLVSSEVRVHLRDYPLPLVYIPGSEVFDSSIEKNQKTFVLGGDMIIAEMMPQSEREIWYRYVPVFFSTSDSKTDDYGCDVVTTICKTKVLYEAECFIDSTAPTTATWSNAYQPVLRHLDTVFDGFSKPTRDPSLKLGVWDKMRDIVHGSLKFKWVNPLGQVQVRVPNATDPYKVLSNSAGFSINFKDDVEWLINDPERENERDYFIFNSNKINFGVPNYLATPLPSWNTNKLIFLPSIKDDFILSSMFGYYLNTNLYYNSDNIEMNRILKITNSNAMKSSNIELDGKIELKLSFSFERDDKETGKRVSTFKPHYENLMTNPDFIEDVKSYDAFKGFRSNYIHMALSLKTEGSYLNTLRLTPRSFRQFFSWFQKFKGVSTPIRHGPLWNFKANSVKLGTHLMTFKFKFLVEPLYIYHGYRIDLINPDNQSIVALKGKIGKFMCDLHERKEKKIKHIEFLDKEYSILSMSFYLGFVELNDIDLRAIGLSFDELKPNQKGKPHHEFEIFDEDESWINLKDFNEIDLPKVNDFNLNGQVLPLLHAKHFKYSMDSQSGESDFGFENTHECGINMDNLPDLKFNHIFDIENLRFKWYCNVRNVVLDYFSEVSFRDAYVYSTSYGSRKLIKERMDANKEKEKENENEDKKDEDEDDKEEEKEGEKEKEREADSDSKSDLTNPAINTSNKTDCEITTDDPIKYLDEMLHKINEKYTGLIPIDDMMIRLSDIQIQLMSNIDDENIILLHTPKNDIEIIKLIDKNLVNSVDKKSVTKRFGTVFKSANLYVISKTDFDNYDFEGEDSCYGSVDNWPIFLTDESSKVLTLKNQIFSDICIIFFFEKINATFVGARRDLLYISIPSLKTKFTSLSYSTFFELTQRLLIYSSPIKKDFTEITEALLNSMDDKKANSLFNQLENEIDELKVLNFIQQSNDVVKNIDDCGAKVDKLISPKIGVMMKDIFLMVKSLILRTIITDKDDKCNLEWNITAKDLKIDFIDNNAKFLSFVIQDGNFSRLEAMDGSNSNAVTIKKVDILNEDVNILFPNLLTSFEIPNNKSRLKRAETFDDMINIKWKLGSPIGGLHDVKLMEINCHPMKLSLEDKTGIKLMKFLFPNHSNDGSDSELDSNYVTSDDDNDIDDSDEEDIKRDVSETPVENNRAEMVTINEPTILEELANSSSLSSQSSKESVGSFKGKTPPTSGDVISLNTNNNKLIVSKQSMRRRRSSTIKENSLMLNEPNHNRGGILKSQLSQSHIANMKNRANNYLNIGKFKLDSFLLSITLYGTGKLRLMNVNNLVISIPMYKVSNKTWGYIDLIKSLKKHIVKTLLRHSGSLIKNKLFVYKKKKRLNRVQSK